MRKNSQEPMSLGNRDTRGSVFSTATLIVALIGLIAATIAPGCDSAPKASLPPTVQEPPVTLGGPMPTTQHADTPIRRGRAIFMNRCTACHDAQPIDEFSMDEWNDRILPIMTRRASLEEQQIADLKAYITAAHALMEQK